MSALRHIALGLVALLALLAGAAWLAPAFLDWNRHRGEVAALAAAALGQPVAIAGDIGLQLLPQPHLVASGVTIEAGPRARIVADQLDLRVALLPLLAGRIEARALVLRRADIRLPWPPDPATLSLRTPSWLSALSARIEDGRLQIGEAAVTGLHATLTTNNATGSFVTAGRAQIQGRDWAFTARVSQPGGDGAVGLDLTLDGLGPIQGTGAALSGQMQADGTVLGRISLRGPDLSRLVPAPAVPFRAEGRLTAADGLIAADELAGELAGAPVKGAIALRLLPRLRLDVALAAGRLDLDSWAPALLRTAEGGASTLPVGPTLPIGIDLSAEAAPWAGGTLRALRGAVDISEAGVAIREARALLPGEAELRLSGRLARADRRLRFEGGAALEAPALRATLAWAQAAGLGPADTLPSTVLPPTVLRSATLRGQLAVADGEIVLSDIAGRLDDAAIVGRLAWRPAPNPTLRAAVALERIDLDAWLPASPPALAALPGTFGPLFLDIQLQSEQAVWQGRGFTALALDVAAAPGRLALRRLAAESPGLTVQASGTVSEGGRIADGRAELRAERAATLEPLAAWALGAPTPSWAAPLMQGSAAVQLQASGAPETLGLRLAVALADLAVEATPTIDLRAGKWAGTVMARHPGAPRLAAMLGAASAPDWLGDGSMALVVQASGAQDRLLAESFDLVAGGMRASGTLRLDRGPVPRLSGRIAADTLMLPKPPLRTADPLALDALSGWNAELSLTARTLSIARMPVLEDAAATVALAAGRLRLDGLAARIAGGRLDADLALDAAPRPPTLALRASLRGARADGPISDLPLDLATGTIDADLTLAATGFSPAGLLASLGGAVSLRAQAGTVSGLDLARMGPRLAEDDLRAALAGGTTRFDRLALDANIESGGLQLARAELAAPAGSVTASGTIDLTKALLALRLAITPPVPDPPEIGLRITGPIDTPERVPELAETVRWRARH